MTANEQDAALSALDRLFLRALLELGESGDAQRHTACMLAASAWSVLRHSQPREAERFNGVLHSLTRARHSTPDEEIPVSQPKTLDVRKLIPMDRHRLIFETYGKLKPGESFVLVNDHDPKPLYYQLEAEYPRQFSWTYVENGPRVWRVEIRKLARAV